MLISNRYKNITIENGGAFETLKQMKEAEQKYGKESVVGAVIGTLFDDEDNFCVLKSVDDTFRELKNVEIFNYSPSITGTVEYKDAIKKYVFGEQLTKFDNSYIGITATTGGTGAIYNSFKMYMNEGDKVLLPNYMWEAYTQIAKGNELSFNLYNLFKDDKFDIGNFENKLISLAKEQGKVLAVINDPCHNPSGYSLSNKEWEKIVEALKKASAFGDVILVNDIAYLDYSNDGYEGGREYLKNFVGLPDNVLILIAFSISKSFTSYGLRVGAQVAISSSKDVIKEFDDYSSYICRATWSNISRSGMKLFSNIVNDNEKLQKVNEERKKVVDMMKNRSSLFIKEAEEVGLKILPYKSGFFITVPLKEDIITTVIDDLKQKNVFVLPVSGGIRIAICSVSLKRLNLLAKTIKESVNKFEK